MPRIAFIACSKTKCRTPCTAEQMYQGVLFKKALAYCKPRFDHVYILSAKYGLLNLTDFISPYEETLNTASIDLQQAWARKVDAQLKERKITGEFWFFTGERYHKFFDGKKPLQGLSLGYQLKWFTNQLQIKQKGFGL